MKFSIKTTDRAEALVGRMGVVALIEQVLCPNVLPGETLDKREYGSAFFHADSREALKDRIAEFKEHLSIPPLITTDMECGPGEMITDGTRFPSIMGCGVTDDQSLAYEMGKAAALEGGEVGFNWTLAPCVDIAAVPDNPIVSLRSPGRDAETVIKTAGAYVGGLQDNGMIATIKHFPGDGFDIYDQHLTTSNNPLSMTDWRDNSGRVFEKLIDLGAMAVMPGHISLAAYDDPDPVLGLCPPATLSKKLMIDLLRGELGFEGLIVSDALNMGGMVGFANYYDAAALFLARGGDCVLFPGKDGFVDEMEKRVESGMLPLDALQDRALRMVSMKDNLGLFDNESTSGLRVDLEKHEIVARDIADRCVKVVRDRARLVPFAIKKDTRVLHLVIANNYQLDRSIFDGLTSELNKLSHYVTELSDPGPDEIFERVRSGEFDLVICSVGNKQDYGTNVARLHGPLARNMMKGWMRLGTPVIFVAHFHPFVHLEYEASIDTIINTYGSTAYAVERTLRGITGEQPF